MDYAAAPSAGTTTSTQTSSSLTDAKMISSSASHPPLNAAGVNAISPTAAPAMAVPAAAASAADVKHSPMGQAGIAAPQPRANPSDSAPAAVSALSVGSSPTPVASPATGAMVAADRDAKQIAGRVEIELEKPITSVETLLNAWARSWAQEKKSSVDWMIHTAAEFEAKVPAKSDLRKQPLNPLTLRQMSPADVASGQPQTVMAEKLLEERQSSNEWSTLVENSTTTVNTLQYTLKRILTQSTTVTLSTQVTYSAGLQIEAGVPLIGTLTVNGGYALNKNQTTAEAKTETKEYTHQLNLQCEPGKKTLAQVQVIESTVTQPLWCKIYFQGGVIINCKDKVVHHVGSRSDKHKKWYIPIHDIVNDLNRFVSSPTVSAEDKRLFQAALDNLTLDHQAIYFKAIVNVVTKSMSNPNVKIKHEAIPGFVLPAAGGNSMPSQQINELGVHNADAEAAYSKAHITIQETAEEFNKKMLAAADAAQRAGLFAKPGHNKMRFGCAVAAGQGSEAMVTVKREENDAPKETGGNVTAKK